MPEGNKKFYKNTFPSPLEDNSVKQSKEYAKAVAEAIYSTFIRGNNSYYNRRNLIFEENRRYAAGKQSLKSYLEEMGFDGECEWSNLNFIPNPIIQKYRRVVIDDFMNRMERVRVTGLSEEINKKRDRRRTDAMFRMDNQDFIQSMKQYGVQLSDDSDPVHASKEEVDIWMELNPSETEEALMRKGINFVLTNNRFDPKLKRMILTDLFDNGLACLKVNVDNKKRIGTPYIRPESLVYGSSLHPDMEDSGYIGHVERMKISDVRVMWPDIEEKKLYRLAKDYESKYGNPSLPFDEYSNYTSYYTRPYDDFLVDVLFFEYKVVEYVDYVKSSDKYGKKTIDFKRSKPNIVSNDKVAERSSFRTIYSGVWFINSDIIKDWGQASDIYIGNADDGIPSFSYVVYIQDHDGDMLPRSTVDLMKSSVRRMDLAMIKMQIEIANAVPNGYYIDVDTIGDGGLDLGTGERFSYLELKKIRSQQGDIYYSSKDLSGDRQGKPIEQNLYQFGDKIQQYINIYNFNLDLLEKFIGVNAYRTGETINPRLGQGVLNAQVQASNNATAHIYNGFIDIYGRVASNISDKLLSMLRGKLTNDMLISILGRDNVDFIEGRSDITKSNYDTKITIVMSQDERQQLDNDITTALNGGLIEFEDAMLLRTKLNENDFDYKLLTLWLGAIKKKRERERQDLEMQKSQQMQEQNGQIQQQTQAQAAQIKEAEDQRAMAKEQIKGDYDLRIEEDKMIAAALLKQQETGSEIPEYIQILINDRLAERQAKAEAEAQQAMAQQMAANQQEHPQEVGM